MGACGGGGRGGGDSNPRWLSHGWEVGFEPTVAVPWVGSGIRTHGGCPMGGKWDSNPDLPVTG